jgi:preprotein translocase subunit SecE
MAVEAKTKSAANNKIVKYFKEIRSEFKKITWPSKDDIIKTTGTVLGFVALLTLVLWAYDSAFGFVLKSILGIVNK